MKQARDYRKYNVRLTSADWQRGSDRVIKCNRPMYTLYDNYDELNMLPVWHLCILSYSNYKYAAVAQLI